MCNDAKINQMKSIFLLEFNALNTDGLNAFTYGAIVYDDRNHFEA